MILNVMERETQNANNNITKISHFMTRTTSGKQILRTLQEFFKGKLQFSSTKIYLINQHSLTPFDHLLAKTRHGVIYADYFDHG